MILNQITPRKFIGKYGPVILLLALVCVSCTTPVLEFELEMNELDGTSIPTAGAKTPTTTVEATPTSLEPIATNTPNPTSAVATPSMTPEPTATQTLIPYGPTMTPFAPPVEQEAPLSEEGPWLAYMARIAEFSTIPSLFISNADGSGRVRLGGYASPHSEIAVSPAGDRFAYVTRDPVGEWHLIIRLVPSGEIEADIEVISPEVLGIISDEEWFEDRIIQAVGGVGSIAWSPHGRYLAFVAALESPNTDIYRFDTWSNNVRRLTSDSLNVYLPSWSPAGDWILHLKGTSIGGLSDIYMDGIWVVSSDGSSTKRLSEAGDGIDFLVSWVDGTSFYATHETRDGPYDLTRRKIDGSTVTDVYSGPFTSPEGASFDDLMSAVAFIIRPTDPVVNRGTSPGIYLVNLDNGIAELILPGDWRSVEWWQGKGVFLANGDEGTVFIRRTGEVVKRMDDSVDPVAPSPQGGWMVTYGEGGAQVYTHIGVFIRQVHDGAVADVIWQLGDTGFFLEAYQVHNPRIGHQLYYYDLSEWDMHLVDPDAWGEYYWIVPPLENP
jgi:hypothetical protein